MAQLKGIVRMDSIQLGQTYFTEEGYLIDHPILTSTGIFEYHENGETRRELRLPEEVFDPESLKSYKSKPIIITHDAGLVTKDNVQENMIGVIMSEGYKSGNDVRAEIVIHDTDEMKRAGLKELSLGYNLDLDETPGTWHGQKYDAIQRNIRVNHLALVKEARAGDQARLNIDSRDTPRKEGKKAMRKKKHTRRYDSVLTPEELSKAIEEYKARRAKRGDEGDDAPPKGKGKKKDPTAPPAAIATAQPGLDLADADDEEIQDQVEQIKDRNTDADDDMKLLFDIIDTLLADRAYDSATEDEDDELAQDEDDELAQDEDDEDDENLDEDEDEDLAQDEDDEDDENLDEDEDEDLTQDEDDEENCDEDEGDDAGGMPFPVKKKDCKGKGGKINTDSVDSAVRDRVNIAIMAEKLGMDNLSRMNLKAAKKAVIRRVTPGLRLDGKSNTYISALFDRAVADVNAKTKKDVGYQMRQMFNKDGRTSKKVTESADSHRDAMIRRMMNRKKVKK